MSDYKTMTKEELGDKYVELAVDSMAKLKEYLTAESEVYQEALAKLEPIYQPYYDALQASYKIAEQAVVVFTHDEQADLSRRVAEQAGIPAEQMEAWIERRKEEVDQRDEQLIDALGQGALN